MHEQKEHPRLLYRAMYRYNLFVDLEQILCRAAQRTYEILGNILPFGAGRDVALRISVGFVINKAAYAANVLRHHPIPHSSQCDQCSLLYIKMVQ